MKRTLLLFVMSIFIIPLVGMVEEEVIINNNVFSLELISSTDQETIIEYNLGNFFRSPVEIDGETYYQLQLAKEANTFDKGEPELPKITRSIIIPDNALMAVQIVESEYVEYAMKIIPSKGLLSRSVNPEDVPYEFGGVYLEDSFYPELRAELGTPYIMRDFRGVTVNAYPFSYNPQTEILRVYTHIVLKVENIGVDSRNVKERIDNRVNRYFREIYSNHFLNFQQTRYDTIEEQGRIIVISYGSFMDAMQPYVDWKIQKGIQCDIYDVADIGTSSAIYTFIQDEYELNDGLTFVLLVGDAAQVQPRNTDEDPTYGLMEGGDNYPEIFISRFSAENVAQVETQVERTIHYERDIDEGEWLHKGCGIASAQGVGDDGEYDNEHIDNIRDKLMNYTYTEVDQIYDYSGTVGQGMDALNDGRSIVNYCGHGYMSGWGNGAALNITNVNALVNDYMLPFVHSVACNVGEFQSGTCFGEAWLRATDNSTGDPTGAIAFYGSTISQSWNPPMRAQDHSIDLLVGWNYSTNQEIDQKFSLGGLWFNGSCNMMDVYPGGGENEFRHWTIFGDASLNVRTDTPEVMSVTHPPTLFIGVNNFTVNTGVEEALVCLSYNNQILGSGYTDASGYLNLELQNVPQTPVDLILTITATNKVTHVENIPLIPNDGPYVIINDYQVNAGGDDYIESGETVYLTICLENIGSVDAENVILVITSDDEFITITDGSEDYGDIGAGTTRMISEGFCFEVSNLAPDLHPLQLTALITAGEDVWEGFINLMIYEPNVFSVDPEFFDLTMGTMQVDTDTLYIINTSARVVDYTIRIDEADNRNLTGSYIICSTEDFTPGETVDWIFTVYNMSPDNEWITDINLEFPYGVTVNEATDFVGGSGGDLIYDGTTGEQVFINWHGETSLGYGLIHGGQSASTTVNVTTSTEFAGNIEINYEIIGDGYGAEPHVITGSIGLSYPLSWISLASSYGTLSGYETHAIEVTFDTSDLEIGTYYCSIYISDGDSRDYKRVPVALTVTNVSTEEDVVTANNVLLGNYPNPFNPETTISFSVDSSIETAVLEIYNTLGQRIRTFDIDTSTHLPVYSVVWDGNDDRGRNTSSGIYFSKLKAGKFTSVKKMILMK